MTDDELYVLLEAENRTARADRDEAIGILTRLVQQANAQKFQGNVEVDEHDFIVAYRMPCGPVHSAIPFLNRFGIVVDEYGGGHRVLSTNPNGDPEPHNSGERG